jgi:uncharacterized protein (TIGR03067 family)
MNERTLFLQALEKATAAEQAAYLAEACGDDLALRHRLEELLQSHREAGGFLATPALEQAATPDATAEGATEPYVPDRADRAKEVLDFLAPPRRPGSLGRLDHYEVQEVVGHGGMGVVLRAFDEKLHRVVALKVMAREIAGSALARKRFSREAKAAAAVVHDHVVPIHAIEDAGPTPYLVMQFIEGQSLQQAIDAEGSLDLKEILRIGMQIASGLAAAHKQGLVHRDVKPSNILLENGVQRVKLTDFGLARTVDDASVSQTGVIVGTPQYMSPEQADGKPIDHRSDLFSLGSVLYAMCTGRPPFRAASTVATLKRVCEDTPRPIRELNPDIPEWLSEVIGRLHAKEPAERYESAQEVATLLERRLADVQQGLAVVTPERASRPVAEQDAEIASKGFCTSPVKKRRWPRVVGWAVVAFLICVCIAIWGNLFSKVQRLFHHELVVQLPDTGTVVEFWETSDTEVRETRMSFTGAWPMEPRAIIANTRTKKLRLPPGNYWLLATKDGKRIDQQLLKIGWGGAQTLKVGSASSPQAGRVVANDPSLNGRWVLIAAEYQGRQVPSEEAQAAYPSELLFKEDRYGIVWAGKQHEGSLRIDPRKSPAEIDFTGSLFAGLKPRKAIYQLDGDRLTLCLPFVGPNADPPRPTSFKTDLASKNVVLVYRPGD